MIADDDDQITRSVLRPSCRTPATGCREAASGMEVLDQCSRHNLDALFLDINIPAMNGFEVMQQLRSIHPTCTW